MSPGAPTVLRLHRAAARLLLGDRLPEARREEMSRVFVDLWREAEGAGPRVRLTVREAWGMVRLARTLRRNRFTWEDGMDEVWRSVKVAARGLRRSPVASMAAAVTLALGIGGTTAVVSLADGVLLDPLPFPDADELVLVTETTEDGERTLLSYENFRDLQAGTRTLDALAVWVGNSVAVTGMGEPERIRGEFVSASYFDVFGVEPALGRVLSAGEDVPGGERTVVLGHDWWRTRFGADPGVLGRTVELNNQAHTVVGVMPPGFRSFWDETQAWISLHTSPRTMDRGSRGFVGVGRLVDGVEPPDADAELDALMGRLAEAHPDANAGAGTEVADLTGWVVGPERRGLVVALLGAATLILLIAVANVASLQLARASRREREMAVRSALGGGRGRLVLQLLVESGVLAAVGGALGVGLAWLVLQGVAATFPGFGAFEIRMSALGLVAATTLTLGAGIVAGLWPALRASRVDPAEELAGGERGGGPGRRATRFRSGLVVAQMALAVTLLVGSGLLLRTVASLNRLDVGFDPERLLTAETRLTAEAYGDDGARIVYMDRVLERLRRIPGTRGATLVSGMPFSGDGGGTPVRTEGSDVGWERATVAFVPVVAPGYFDVMEIPVLAGRTFEVDDDRSVEFRVVLSRSLTDRLLPGLDRWSDAVGRRIETPEGAARIVGVVEDTRRTLAQEIEPAMYLSYRQLPRGLFNVLLRTEGPPAGYERILREAFWEVDSNQPLWEILPMQTRMAGWSATQRFVSGLLGAFAALALALAGVGIYGVVAYTVSLRRREMGIRLALGADGGRIRRMVLAQGLRLVAVAVPAGLLLALLLSRSLETLVYRVSPADPATYAAAAGAVAVLGLAACWIPALRATRVDPTAAFRE